ncbi:ABC transporter ATP-binding protein [Rhizobium sp. BK251]|uniref:ABC transporter ATP-binding protein n=1 Tax=Rhizobium sp. BK251 TaxID=2512125 RepID=UPI001050D66A|nr:ABC transporter ATP-binding protein [Rhizobium sp. BK251]TCL68079.1 NitT/TauT family transport system ATP-binding protein [Rhizobium sp. BK251]
MKNLVELIDVSLRYGAALAVSNLSLAVPVHSFAAVVGPSGCGKSSVLKLVAGLVPASSGTVLVEGQQITAPVGNVGMAFQNANLLPWRTALDNVLLPLEVVRPERYQFSARRQEFTARAMELLCMMGLESFTGHYPWQLSGGMQQRVSLCRALIHQPQLLVLDEPFASLDALTREELWDVVQKIWAERPLTVILVTHDLREALYLADQVHVMSSGPGQVVNSVDTSAFGRPRGEELLSNANFNEQVVALKAEIRSQRALFNTKPTAQTESAR